MASYLFLCLFLFFPHLYASFSSSGSHFCSSLIQFKNSFSITEGASLYCDKIAGPKSYPKTNSWKEGTDCCSWDGVTCDHLNAHAIALDLSCSWLYGNFPSNTTLFLLPHLQKLNLAFNNFNLSKIPSELDRFTSLFYLNLYHTGFAGEVPSQFSHLSKLVSLDLSSSIYDYEQFTFDKHALEGLVQNLTEVRHLFLDGINMKIPKNIFDLPNLNLLNLGGNQNLNLDPLKFNRSSNLEHLDLSWMSSSTEFIDSVDNLQALEYLDLSGNSSFQGLRKFFGGLPDSMGNLVSLKFLDLSNSNLSTTVPRSLENFLQLTHLNLSLKYLEISKNTLEGSIPDDVTACPNLISLGLSDNLLNGMLPSWLYTAPSLKTIYVSQNQFSGHIKEFQSKSLEYLYLSNNKLQGPLPSSIFQLLNLTFIVLSSNNLSGVIEFSMFSNLPNLRLLDLSYNNLSLTSNSTSSVNHILSNLTDLLLSSCNLSEFPQFLKGLKSLESLDLSCNKIEGKIPQWMQKVGNDSLSFLNVSHNSLTEVEHFPWKNIEVLDLSSSLIRGNLPIPASTIHVFLISNNSFSGEVSSLICNATYLRILDFNSLEFLNLKKNKFYGTIPPTFAKGCRLSNFNLNGNLLEGPLAPSILNCRGLEVLDLGNNKINDTFPHWLESLPFLQVLVLKSNHMHGSLRGNSSKSSPFFSKIQNFDLSSNYFSGPLPVRYINSFKAIINLEKIGNCRFYTYSIGIVMKGQDRELFEGGIPKVIGKLNLLKGLNLSHNNLNGDIPTSIGNLTSLEWLDLSSNRLSGTIPNRLADLPFLSSLNVSDNQLHGSNIIEPPAPPNVLEKDGSKSNIAFDWKVVLIGYGCGVVFGMLVGYVVFQTGKPKWLVNLVENQHEKSRRRNQRKAIAAVDEEGSNYCK
ncbi:hypothetical protein ES288_D05G424100v1 [Gossypium darwinii]|uniref:Leucine-rich repeat-containing N-terminal plant-type domain-containing protein n=1 Tax=Gossypium darwinii TaxID=34276 RepID=A0A5D2CQB4_GOSDA|nr:hypothetical protein ES288_D05G424100v1 [Gossypium darwinii]